MRRNISGQICLTLWFCVQENKEYAKRCFSEKGKTPFLFWNNTGTVRKQKTAKGKIDKDRTEKLMNFPDVQKLQKNIL